MKRILISVVVLVGVGGLIALLSFHPKAKQVTVATQSSVAATAPSDSPEDSSPAQNSGAAPQKTAATSAGKFKDGTYTGAPEGVIYGTVQVQAVISGGKLTGVNFLRMPSGGNSDNVTAMAKPALLQEALSAQSAQVNTVSGATQTSGAFVQSLGDALKQAQA